MTAPVFRNLELLSSAPGGIQRLREVIWELAVRGLITGDEPDSWRRLSLGELGQWGSGGTPLKTHSEYYGGDIPWLVIGDLNDGLVTAAEQSITAVGLANSSAKLVPAGTVLIAMYGSIGKLGIAGLECATNQAIAHCQPNSSLVSSRYLFLLLRSMRSEFLSRGQGLAQQNISQKILKAVDVNLPPLEKQSRIVAKVDELMALCDRLEARQQDAEAAHARLVQALLDSLTKARDAEEFRACWQRVAGQFELLLTREESVDALKQVVLSLAISGQLTGIASDDGEAGAELAKHRIGSKDHARKGWATVALGDLGSVRGGATPSKARPDFWAGQIPWVSPKDMKRPEIADAEDHVSAAALDSSPLRLIPANSILMVVRGMILAHSFPVARTLAPVTINQDMKALVPPADLVSYLLLALQALKPQIVATVDRSSHGTCKLVSDKLWSIEIGIPPLAEQHRIVAKVTELLALCDQLKARIAAARAKHAQLAEALVAQAIAV